MEEKFVNYLESIGITQALMPRIENVIEVLENLSGEKIIDIFISEYMEEDGTRIYEDFRSFSKSYHLGAIKFLHDFRYFIWNRHTKSIRNINWDVSNYDFKSASPDSRLNLACYFSEGSPAIPAILKASQNNCDKLFALYKEYLLILIGSYI